MIAEIIARPLAQRIVVTQGAGAPITPDQVPGLLAWYDASHAASFTYNTGTSVQTWADKSGHNITLTYELSQSNTRPTRGATDWDGTLPGVTFVDGCFFGSASAGSSKFVIFVVCKPSTIDTAYRALASDVQWMLLSCTGAGKWGTYGTAERNANTALVVGTKYLLEMTGGNSGTFMRNGASDGTYADTSGTGPTLRFGTNDTGQRFLGVIAEALFYDPSGGITSTDRTKIRTYLNSKWTIY